MDFKAIAARVASRRYAAVPAGGGGEMPKPSKLPSEMRDPDEYQVWVDDDGTPWQFHWNGKLYLTKGVHDLEGETNPANAVFNTDTAEEISPEDADYAESEWEFVEEDKFSLHT